MPLPSRSPAVARVATPDDIPEIVRVTNAAYRVEDFFIDGDRTHAAEVSDKLRDERAVFLVVDRPDEAGAARQLAASVYVVVRGDRGYFGMLSVDPAMQKRGFGRVLIDAIDAHLRAAGCAVVDIDVVNLRLELPAFYQALGFVATGTAPFLNPHTTRDAHLITMEKSLRTT